MAPAGAGNGAGCRVPSGVENHPLAVELGEWVIGAVLDHMEFLRDAGLDIPIVINVGPPPAAGGLRRSPGSAARPAPAHRPVED